MTTFEVSKASADPLSAIRNWEPRFAPIRYTAPDGSDREAPGFVSHRSDTGAAIGVVGPRFRAITNAAKVELFDALAARGVVSQMRAGCFDDGARVWIQAATGKRLEVAGQPIEHRFTAIDGYDGSVSMAIVDTDVNIVCRNTFQRAYREGRGQRMRHTRSIGVRYDAIAAAIKASIDGFERSVETLRDLARKPMSHDGWKAALDALFPLPAKDAAQSPEQAARNRLAWAYEASPGAMPGTAYGAVQAVTYYATHERGRDKGRFESSIVGEGARLSRQVLDLVLA